MMEIESFLLGENDWVPNNARLPVVIYRAALDGEGEDLAGRFEALFEDHGWPPDWRDGIFDYHHYHSTAHEVLGVFAGKASHELGGPDGHKVSVAAGDALMLPVPATARFMRARISRLSAPIHGDRAGTSAAKRPTMRHARGWRRFPIRSMTPLPARRGQGLAPDHDRRIGGSSLALGQCEPESGLGGEREPVLDASAVMKTQEDGPADTGEAGTIVDAQEAAENAGLVYVTDDSPGIVRQPYRGKFRYRDARGNVVTDEKTLKRIASLAIPPAYTDVWICPKANGHIQATGRDAKGRKQYRYHPRFREVRDSTKYEHMLDFAKALPGVRERIDADLKKRGLPREKVLAAVVHLLETTMIRIGNADYAKQNKSYGLTTLQDRHVAIEGAELRFNFKGKSGKQWRLKLKDRRIAKIVKASQDLPGQHLFQYVGEDGAQYEVTSNDINAYLREISGTDITAKDFRTWNGTVLAALALSEYEKVDSQAAAKRNVRTAIEAVASRLGNTPTVCRKCYIHPEVFESYLSDELVLEARDAVEKELREDLSRLRPEEAVVLAFLQRRLAEKAKVPAL
ncbi:hypothetical protein [Sphingobium fuliginis]|jgi:DNA topoisomerase-1|nr:hypothetical protein [Sphingobium fuliginis]